MTPTGRALPASEGKHEPSYNILFLLDLEDLGRIRIDAHVSKNDLRVIFYMDQPSTVELVTRELPNFSETLRTLGYREVLLAARPLRGNSAGQGGKIRRVGHRSSLDDQPARLEGIIMDRHPNESRQVVALRYEPKRERAPKVVAKGRGYLADKIIEIAREHNIPIRQDKNLLQILSRLDLNDEIPTEVYKAVAEILAFIYRLSNRQPIR